MSPELRGIYRSARIWTGIGIFGIISLGSGIVLYERVETQAQNCLLSRAGTLTPPDETAREKIRATLRAENPNMDELMLDNMAGNKFRRAVGRFNFQKATCWEEASLISSARRFFRW